jgi:thiol-disulfide isomerase/thioredoxin
VQVIRGLVRTCRRTWVCLLSSLVFAVVPLRGEPVELGGFELREIGSGRMVPVSAFAGKILVLDFFAHWCGPCAPASRDLERNVREHFQERNGNVHGVGVEVVSVNVEPEHPGLTRDFLERAGIAVAYDDTDGAFLEKLEGTALPFIVILDGRHSGNARGVWEVVHRGAGYPGAGMIRALVNSIGGPDTSVPAGASDASVAGTVEGGGAIGATSAEGAVEFLQTDDVALSSANAAFRHVRPAWEGQVTAGFQGYELTYEPDLLIPDRNEQYLSCSHQTHHPSYAPPIREDYLLFG